MDNITFIKINNLDFNIQNKDLLKKEILNIVYSVEDYNSLGDRLQLITKSINDKIIENFIRNNNLGEDFKDIVNEFGINRVFSMKNSKDPFIVKFSNEIKSIYKEVFLSNNIENFYKKYEIDYIIQNIKNNPDKNSQDYFKCMLFDKVEDLVSNIVIQENKVYNEDLASAGKIGVLKALDKYEPEKASFTGYAFFVIRLEIQLERSKLNKHITVPTYYYQAYSEFKKTCENKYNNDLVLDSDEKIETTYRAVKKIFPTIEKENFIGIVQYFNEGTLSIDNMKYKDSDSDNDFDLLNFCDKDNDPIKNIHSNIDYSILVDTIKEGFKDKNTIEKMILQRKLGIQFDNIEYNQFTAKVEKKGEIKNRQIIAFNGKQAVSRLENLGYKVLSSVEEIEKSLEILPLDENTIFEKMIEMFQIKNISQTSFANIKYHEDKLIKQLREYLVDLSIRTNSNFTNFKVEEAIL